MDHRFKDCAVFLETLSLSAINRNLHDIEAAWTTASDSAGAVTNVQALDTAYSALLQHPDSDSTIIHFTTIWHGLDEMNSLHAITSLRTRLDRECIMLTTFFAWRWLDAYCPHKIQEVLEGWREGIVATSWIGKLACDVCALLERRVDHHQFEPLKYGLTVTAVPFLFSNKRLQILVNDRDLFAAATTCTLQIIASWLQFPVQGVSRYQAWFVHAITRTIGRHALVLDEVWRGYSQVRKYVLGDSDARVHCNQRFERLVLQLRVHALANMSSPESDALNRLNKIMDMVRTPPAIISRPLELMDMDDDSSVASPGQPDMLNSSFQLPVETLVHPMPAPYSVTHKPCRSTQAKLARFMRFLDEALEAVRLGLKIARPNLWQTLMLSDVDRFCPFRELAPSRQRIAGAAGPYTSDRAATQSGFFSALIFRAITFNTEFLHTAQLLYTDYPAFTSAMAESATQFRNEHGHNPPPSFFCNPRAYGPHNPGRTIKLAQVYGPVVEADNIAAQVVLAQKNGSTSSISFVAFWKWLKGAVNGHVRFLHLGPLGSYLLAADYTYTNPRLVAPPTIEELGEVICTLNKGAVHGLELLDLIPYRERDSKGKPKPSTPKACIEGLKIVYNTVYGHWAANIRGEVRFDLVMIEHSLCKLARAIGQKKFSL
ncbi:hypothetical protein C8R45DRAFT_1112346 [Mycena sanguinolenta]|nr:hypothetical protein C8R45DRAFT_1112346 [Mycena sanguinolenta]